MLEEGLTFSGLCVPIRGYIFVPHFRYLGVAVRPLLHNRPFFMKNLHFSTFIFSSFFFFILLPLLRSAHFRIFYLPYSIIFFKGYLPNFCSETTRYD